MSKGTSPSDILRPMATHPLQSHLGRGLHTLGLLGWILDQTGPADIYVSTFSTSDAFLRGFYNLKKKGLVLKSVLLADLKASKKTYKLYKEMQRNFDAVYLAQNHSKVVLVQNDKWTVTVISSQNQTYGDRAETTLVTTYQEIFYQQYSGFSDIIDDNSILLNGLFKRLADQNKRPLLSTDSPSGDFRTIGF
ncbi:MAG: C4-dicarboxylate ABC transporter [Prevotella sp.]|nr:C4-dicarboxylate ABC transporter [Prevotella sp.]MBO5157235.1 C4-dicarboxylate ABC transporter [Prevotella sp.]